MVHVLKERAKTLIIEDWNKRPQAQRQTEDHVSSR
jgi:hypothetical protein